MRTHKLFRNSQFSYLTLPTPNPLIPNQANQANPRHESPDPMIPNIPDIVYLVAGVGALIGLIPACSYLDRLVGSGEQGRTKPVMLAAGLFTLAGAAQGFSALTLAAFALVFVVWRTPGFGHNVLTPTNGKEERAAFIRHFVFSLFMLVPAFLAGAPAILLAYAVVVAALFANEARRLAVENARIFVDGIDRNAEVERARGLAFGLTVAAVFIPLAILKYTGHVDETRQADVVAFVQELLRDQRPPNP
jgi:hypothetical protein